MIIKTFVRCVFIYISNKIWQAIRSKAVVLPFFIHCLLLLPSIMGVLCLVLILSCSTSSLAIRESFLLYFNCLSGVL